jgi:predicted GNAT superfamily acetyltransferase
MTGWRKKQIAEKQKYYHIKTHCDDMLRALLGSDKMVEQWWLSQNLNFELKTPQEVFDSSEEGQMNVMNYLSEHCYGGYH